MISLSTYEWIIFWGAVNFLEHPYSSYFTHRLDSTSKSVINEIKSLRPNCLIGSGVIDIKEHASILDISTAFNLIDVGPQSVFSFSVPTSIIENESHPFNQFFQLLTKEDIVKVYNRKKYKYRNLMNGEAFNCYLLSGKILKNIPENLLGRIEALNKQFVPELKS